MAGSNLILVKAGFDDEADVWYVESSDLPGLSAEADSLEALAKRLPDMVRDLIEANGPGDLATEGGLVVQLVGEVSAKVPAIA
jgi:hypothetical protein